MRVYSIFDDFGEDATRILEDAGINVMVHPFGVSRPDHNQMKQILEEYDCVIIGTSQKITTDMFERISTSKIIATASVGTDHIQIPDSMTNLITVLNTPNANAQSVAEYTMGCALSCCKRLYEAKGLYCEGKDNKQLTKKPEDLKEKTIGVVGAGIISCKIMEYARFFGMKVICWTPHPERHTDLKASGVIFETLERLVQLADVISVNLPNKKETEGIISGKVINLMKEEAIFISVSRLQTICLGELISKADTHKNFYVCLDIDVNQSVTERDINQPNILITPHIAGGTIETRKRMFMELSDRIIKISTQP